MPASRAERIVFVVGLALIALLTVFLLPAWRSYASSEPETVSLPPQPLSVNYASTAKVAKPLTPATRPAKATRTKPVTKPKPVKTATKPAAVAPAAASRLVLVATRGDCWLSVHSGSSSGPTLYEGTLAKGQRRNFPLGKIWVRFGAPQNVDANLGTKRATIPSGSFNVVFTRSGAEAAPES